jgi:hypothetical protein
VRAVSEATITRISFPLRLQPHLDQPAKGFGTAWRIILLRGPSVDRSDKLVGKADRTRGIGAGPNPKSGVDYNIDQVCITGSGRTGSRFKPSRVSRPSNGISSRLETGPSWRLHKGSRSVISRPGIRDTPASSNGTDHGSWISKPFKACGDIIGSRLRSATARSSATRTM